ncbi:hypothetical protein LEP3755_66370 (plasmid) [Leptolyngbya sp. NIES-3755]|nr:hypothetical protein LEP3755_66370 [Leptolyngbya sp. NIES-3755]
MSLTGTAGNDSLIGSTTNDTLSGRTGNDYLDGRGGADTYLFSRGDGHDTIDDNSNDTSIDQLLFSGTGLTSTNVVVTRVGDSNDLRISFGGTSDAVTLKKQVYGGGNSLNYGVERVRFSNGVIWTEEQLWNSYLTQGATSNDRLQGTNLSNTLRGGLGNDYLDGQAGADIYLFSRGDGHDTIDDSSNDSSIDQLVFSGTGLTAGNVIVTRLGDSNDLRISFGGTSDAVTLKKQVYGGGNSLNYGVERVRFSDGVIWTEEQLWNAYLTQGAAGNDRLEGTRSSNTLRGGLGNDYLDGQAGADTYLFNRGDGYDTIDDSSNDTSIDQLVFSGAGLTAGNAIVTRIDGTNDLRISFKGNLSDTVILKKQIYGSGNVLNYGIERIKFSDGVVWTEAQLWNTYRNQPNQTLSGTLNSDTLVGGAGDDKLSGLGGNDSLRGGLGSDYLDGGAGADTYLFQLGDGADTIFDNSNDTSLDQLVFSGTGLTVANAIVTRTDGTNDLQISFGGGLSESIVLKNQLFLGFASNYGVESIKFSDGTIWNEAQLWNSYLTRGAATDDDLRGTPVSNTLRGGLGNDYLDGDNGADTYLFQLGDGADILYDSSNDAAIDQLVLSGAGLTAGNAIVDRIDGTNDLQLSFSGLSESIVLKNQLFLGFASNYGVESIKFSDGTTWNEAQLWNAYLTRGAATDDNLVGTPGNNVLRGGLGNDYLDGKNGADTYLFNALDGADIIDDSSPDASVDVLVLSGAGLESTNVRATRVNTDDVQLSFGGSSASILLKNQLFSGLSANYGVESIRFSNGTTWTEAQLRSALS